VIGRITQFARRLVRLPRWLVVQLLRGYRAVVSPLYGPTCRFYPSCSAYALTAVERYGVIRGGRLAVWRVLRCNPWNPGGVDPVPPLEVPSHECSVGSGDSGEGSTASVATTSAPSHVRRVA
jgi:putative membrane protein insertion efficiency factor